MDLVSDINITKVRNGFIIKYSNDEFIQVARNYNELGSILGDILTDRVQEMKTKNIKFRIEAQEE